MDPRHLLASALLALARPNDRPVIGIMVQPASASDHSLLKHGSMYLPASYEGFVEGAGARAAPVPYNHTAAEREALFGQLSGLLLPGGHCDDEAYNDAVNIWLDMAEQAKRHGDVFPVHGICQGFQQMLQWAAGTSAETVLSHNDAYDLLQPLQPFEAPWPPSSWLLQDVPDDVVHTLLETNSTVHLHHFGVNTALFAKGAVLDNGILQPLAKGTDRAGVEFVALVEGTQLPFSASQYHPEKNAYEFGGVWNNDPQIEEVHSDGGIAASQWLARRFVANARESSHHWPLDGHFPLLKDVTPVSSQADFDWERCYFWGEPSGAISDEMFV